MSNLSDHVCGCYFTTGEAFSPTRHYLPQVKLESHAFVTPVSFCTTLKQTFSNPQAEAIKELRYSFPLFDGVAVKDYIIRYGDRTLRGVVKQKHGAKKTFQAAVERGETAGLLDTLPAGVFGVTLGNVPARMDVVVEVSYVGDLKHDAGIDGLRYTLPTSIAPRYGSYPGELLRANAEAGGIKIRVDIDMGANAIRKAQSPSHPIAVAMGGDERIARFNPSQATTTLSLGTAELADDFVLQLLIDDISKPQAIIETHSSLPNQRAIMATLVPKFTLRDGTHHPEIVFLADQSGSMSGSKNKALVNALKIFLKSMPIGIRFNVCAFGSNFDFLWPKSLAYNEENLARAIKFVTSFTASYGGTEILNPIKKTFEQRLDLPLEVILLTDGEVWQEGDIFSFINDQIHEKCVDARVFALGIGGDVSHTLVGGVAGAGNGFAQFVTQNEETDQKVIRMLKAALYPHTRDYSLEVNYDDRTEKDADDDFEFVEKTNDCLIIDDQASLATTLNDEPQAAAVSFFDESAEVDKPTEQPQGRYAHLPIIETPRLLQAPHRIPPLFPFNRTTLYLLLSADSAKRKVNSITIRATAAQGKVELIIPVQGQQDADRGSGGVAGDAIHTLAARKAVEDLEEGRGWLYAAVGSDGRPLKEKHGSRFDELVEHEAVRLGERFQIAGKWCSFVAVQDASGLQADDNLNDASRPNTASSEHNYIAPQAQFSGARYVLRPTVRTIHYSKEQTQTSSRIASSLSGSRKEQIITQSGSVPQPSSLTFDRHCRKSSRQLPMGFSGFQSLMKRMTHTKPAVLSSSSGGGAPAQRANAMMATGQGGSSLSSMQSDNAPSSIGRAVVSDGGAPGGAMEDFACNDSDEEMGFGLFDDEPIKKTIECEEFEEGEQSEGCEEMESASYGVGCSEEAAEEEEASSDEVPSVDNDLEDADGSDELVGFRAASLGSSSSAPKKKASAARFLRQRIPTQQPAPLEEDDDAQPVLRRLIDHQTFAGAWAWSEELCGWLGVKCEGVDLVAEFGGADAAATALVIAYLQEKEAGKKEVWEMVAAKACSWLASQVRDQAATAGDLVEKAKRYL